MSLKSKTAVDQKSMADFINNSTIIHRIDSNVSKATRLRIVVSDAFVEAYVGRLAYADIHTIEELDCLLGEKESLVTKFVHAWFCGPAGKHSSLIPAGIGISFLCWTIVLDRGGIEALTEFLTQHAFNKTKNPTQKATALRDAYDKAKKK